MSPTPCLARTVPPGGLYADEITLARRRETTPPIPRIRGRIARHQKLPLELEATRDPPPPPAREVTRTSWWRRWLGRWPRVL